MVMTDVQPGSTTLASTDTLARTAISDLIDFWADLPVDPIDAATARRELMAAVPSLRRLAEALGA